MLQTDNGAEFNHTQKTKRIQPLDVLRNKLHITHKTITPSIFIRTANPDETQLAALKP